MVLEAIPANVSHEPLKFGHLDYRTAAKGLERIVGEAAVAVSLVLVAATLISCYLPARKAISADAICALRLD
jgi:hypothetical protein